MKIANILYACLFVPCMAQTAQPFQSIDTLIAAVESDQFKSIEDLLKELKSYAKSKDSGYVPTLVYNSRSLQEASTQSPRAVVFLNESKLILAFNGDPQQPGYDKIEVIGWNEQDREFEFREIFDKGTKSLAAGSANPTKCFGCHTQARIPIWEDYPNWPGVYAGHRSIEAAEVSEIESFLASYKNNSRYKYLPNLDEFLNKQVVEGYIFILEKITRELSKLNMERFAYSLAQHPVLSRAVNVTLRCSTFVTNNDMKDRLGKAYYDKAMSLGALEELYLKKQSELWLSTLRLYDAVGEPISGIDGNDVFLPIFGIETTGQDLTQNYKVLPINTLGPIDYSTPKSSHNAVYRDKNQFFLTSVIFTSNLEFIARPLGLERFVQSYSMSFDKKITLWDGRYNGIDFFKDYFYRYYAGSTSGSCKDAARESTEITTL